MNIPIQRNVIFEDNPFNEENEKNKENYELLNEICPDCYKRDVIVLLVFIFAFIIIISLREYRK